MSRTYTYRWGVFHFASTALLAFVGLLILIACKSPRLLNPVIALIIVALAIVAVATQLTTWNERIRLDGNGIVWTDCLGRVRIRARVEQIYALDESISDDVSMNSNNVNGSSDAEDVSYRILTTVGVIQFSRFLRGHAELTDTVQRILDDRQIAPRS